MSIPLPCAMTNAVGLGPHRRHPSQWVWMASRTVSLLHPVIAQSGSKTCEHIRIEMVTLAIATVTHVT